MKNTIRHWFRPENLLSLLQNERKDMSVWGNVRRALLIGVCASSFLWPYESEAADRRNDNRLVAKQQKKRRKPQQRYPQQQQIPQQRQHVSRDAGMALSELVASAQHGENMSYKHKKILIEALKLMAQTPKGKWILCNMPVGVKFSEFPEKGAANGLFAHGTLTLCLNRRLLNNVAKEQNPAKRQRALYYMISTMSHELTHACQNNHSICRPRVTDVSTIDYTMMVKLREFHAVLESLVVRDQLLELPAFSDLKQSEPQLYSNSFLRKATERKRNEGFSREAAERFARTEWLKSLWKNTPSTPVKIGEDLFFVSDREHVFRNSGYNREAFGKVIKKGQEQYYRDTGLSIDGDLRQAAAFMGVDISPEFFKKEKAFQYERGRMIGYLDGIKNEELDYLTVGRIIKKYENNHLISLSVIVDKPKNGSFKDYWHGTNRVRATYTVKGNQVSGKYREYNYSGQQIAEIPFSKGKANGTGWVIEQGKKVGRLFRDNLCWGMNGKALSNPTVQSEAYWRQKYLERQKGSRSE